MLEQDHNKTETTDQDNETKSKTPRARVRSARVIRTLVMTALAALPMKACSGARQASVERPPDGVAATADAGTSDPAEREPDASSSSDAGGGDPEPGDPRAPDGAGRVWRGGEEGDGGTRSADGSVARVDEDGSGRVWRGAPGEDRYDEDRDAAEPEDARRRRDYVVPDPVPPYGVAPVPDYGIPEPIIRPLYAVEPPPPMPMYGVEPVPEYMAPLPEMITYYGVPVPPPVAAYAVPAPDDDDDLGPVLRYGVPSPR